MSILLDDTRDFRKTPDGRRLYKCDNCGKVGPWDGGWAWYGSYRQMEDYGLKGVDPLTTICSASCRVAMVAVGKLPAEGLDDSGDVIDDASDDAPPRFRRR